MFRHSWTQVWCSGGATTTVRRQPEGVTVARQSVQPVVHRGLHQRLHGPHDILATDRERRGRGVQHVDQPSGVYTPATGHNGRTLPVRRTRAQAGLGDHAPERVVDVDQQSSVGRPGGSAGAHLHTGSRHARQTGQTFTSGMEKYQYQYYLLTNVY